MDKLTITAQSTIETCLSVCLMSLLQQKGVKLAGSEELNIFIEGLKFTKFDYSTGHLVYVCSKYDVEIEQYTDFPLFHKFLSQYQYPPKLKLISQKIDHRLLIKLLKSSPIIVYVDQYYLSCSIHISHFVILENLQPNFATVLDPWDGRRKKLATKLFLRSIQSLRNLLKISPKIIRIL